MNEKFRVCKKCLPGYNNEEIFYKDLSRYIQRMDEDVKVDQQCYEKRLSTCRRCEFLLNRMCRLCGCFVELRAVQKARKCPDVPERWSAQITESFFNTLRYNIRCPSWY